MMILGGIFMRKMFYILLLILACPLTGYAEVVYSPYSKVQEVDDYMESSDLIEVEEVLKYRFYQEEKVFDEEYRKLKEIKEEYPLIDVNDYIWSEFSTYQAEEILEDEQTKVETRIVHQYKKKILVDKLKLNYVSALADDINLRELKIKVGKDEIVYHIEGIEDTKKLTLSREKPLVIQLEKEYDPLDLYFSLQVFNPGAGDFDYHYTLTTLDDETLLYEDKFVTHTNGPVGIYRFLNLKESLREPLYEEKITTSLEKPTDDSLYLGEKIEYRYREKMYKTYHLEKVYLDGYYMEADGIKDSEQEKVFYQYRTRNYIDFYDQLTNFSPVIDISFLVKSSSYDLNQCKITTKNVENSQIYVATLDCQGDIYERTFEVVPLPVIDKTTPSKIETSIFDNQKEENVLIQNDFVMDSTKDIENNDEKIEENSRELPQIEEKDWGKPLKKKSASFIFDYRLVVSLSLMSLGIIFILIGVKKYVDEKK